MMELATEGASQVPVSSVAIVPPLIQPGDPDFAVIRTRGAQQDRERRGGRCQGGQPERRQPWRSSAEPDQGQEEGQGRSPSGPARPATSAKVCAACSAGSTTNSAGLTLWPRDGRRVRHGLARSQCGDAGAERGAAPRGGGPPGAGPGLPRPARGHLVGRAEQRPRPARSPSALAAADDRVRVVDNPAGRTPHALNAGIAAPPRTTSSSGSTGTASSPTATSPGRSSCWPRPGRPTSAA